MNEQLKMKQKRFLPKLKLSLIFTAIVSLLGIYAGGLQPVFAGTLTQSTIMEYNMATSGVGNIAVAFKTASASATSVSMNFSTITAASGTLGSAPSMTSTTLANCQALFGASVVAVPSPTSPSVSSPTISFSTTAMSASTYYCAIITGTNLVTNPATAGTYTIPLTVGSDTQTDGIDVISSDTYTISGTVPSSFTMSLGSGSDTFTGNLTSTTYTTTTGETVTINTNSASGWMLWAADANAGLLSSSKSQSVGSVATGSLDDMSTGTYVGHNAFAVGVTSVSAGSAATNYNDSTGYKGGGITATSTGFQQIASDPSSNTSADNVTVKLLADVAATDPASNDYNDTITLVGAGSF
jgi:hypothetical protein